MNITIVNIITIYAIIHVINNHYNNHYNHVSIIRDIHE
jgi:hypothetical protein